MEILTGVDMYVEDGNGAYHVPTTCDVTKYPAPCGLGSTLGCNTTVLMYPDVQQYLVPSQLRVCDDSHIGFLCCYSSPSSASSKGMIRFLASKVVIRCYYMGVRDHVLRLIQVLESRNCPCIKPVNNVHIFCRKFPVCQECLTTIRTMCIEESLKGPHCVTMHVSANGDMALSFCTGTIMRKTEEHPSMWVDNLCEQPSLMDYCSVISEAVSLMPFPQYINPIRAGLFSTYLTQAVCTPSCRYDTTRVVVPLYSELPLMLRDNSTNDEALRQMSIPGLNLFAVFCNMHETYENGVVLSASAASRFKYYCIKAVSLPNGSRIPDISSVICPFSVPWWQVPFEGVVVSVTRCISDRIRVLVEYIGYPVDGDKFTTLHGQKGVATVLEDSKMPVVNGRVADIVIGSSAIVKCHTASQLLEAACGFYCIQNKIEPCTRSYEQVLDKFAVEYRSVSVINAARAEDPQTIYNEIIKKYEGPMALMDNEGEDYTVKRYVWDMCSTISSTQHLRVNCGYIHVMQSIFMASSKMSCTKVKSTVYHRTTIGGLNRGGSAGLGEMELSQLEASGFKHCIEEFSNRSAMCVVDVCSRCSCITILCSCEEALKEEFGTYPMLIPFPSVKAMIGMRVCLSVNTELTSQLD